MSVNAYNRINLSGPEVLGTDPIVNLFIGREYYSTALEAKRVYNGSAWITIPALNANNQLSITSSAAGYVGNFVASGVGGIGVRGVATNTGSSAAYFIDTNAANADPAVYVAKLGTGSGITVDANGSGIGLALGGTSTANRITFYGSTSGSLGLNVPAAITSYNIVLPAAQGAVDTFLKNDGAGNLSWSTAAASFFSPYTKRVGPGEAYTTLAAVAAAAVAGDWILVTGNTTDTADVDFSTEDLVIEWSPGAVSSFTGVAHVSCLQISGNRCKLMKPYVYFQQTNNVTDCLLISATDSVHVVAGTFVIDTGSTTVTNAIRLTQSYGLISAAFQNVGSATITNLVTDSGVNNVQVVGP